MSKKDKGYVLDPSDDAMLIRGLPKYAEAAGLSGNEQFITHTVEDLDFFSDDDWELAQKIPQMLVETTKCGLIYQSDRLSHIPKKFMAFTGVMVRHYIDDCYQPMLNLMDSLEAENYLADSRILFVPDFATWGKKSGERKKVSFIPQWKRDMLLSYLLRRQSQQKPTVLFIRDEQYAAKFYGE